MQEEKPQLQLPFQKELGPSVVTLKEVYKRMGQTCRIHYFFFHNLIDYNIPGRNENVRALEQIDLHDDSEFYAIKCGEFVMIRGPSGGGKTTYVTQLMCVLNSV